MDPMSLTISAVIGAIGGVLGGLFGIGGGLVIIPLLTLAFGSNPHQYQAASLVAALLVAAGSIPRHWKARAIRIPFALKSIPFALLTVGGGVAIGVALPNPHWLERIFGGFLVYVAALEVYRGIRGETGDSATGPANERLGWGPAALVGGAMGTLSGLLGIGGGVIAIPLMRTVNRFNIRATIATSAFLVLPTVVLGAILKFATLKDVTTPSGAPISVSSALILAAALAPGAFFGAALGAGLVHRVPMSKLGLAFAVMCGLLSLRMLGIVR